MIPAAPTQAVDLYLRALRAEGGPTVEAMLGLDGLLDRRPELAPAAVAALSASAATESRAALALSGLHFRGWVVPEDRALGAEWALKAVRLGVPPASATSLVGSLAREAEKDPRVARGLAALLREGAPGVPADPERARALEALAR